MSVPASESAGLAAALRAIVGETGLRSGEALDGLDPGADARNLRARLLVRPANTAELAAVLGACSAAGVAVVPQGGRTGLAGGAVSKAGEVVLSLERMNRIERIDVVSRTATVEAGVTLEALAAALEPHGLAAGIDLGARGSATIGGMVSTNAGGIDAFRYGTMRERVLGLEAVLADGTVLGELSRVRKDNAGLPLRQLFIGAEGTLGVVSRVVLALVRAGGPQHAALVLVPHLDAALGILQQIDTEPGLTLAAAELMSGNHVEVTARALGVGQVAAAAPAAFAVLFAVSGPDPDALTTLLVRGSETGAIVDALLPKNAAEERDLWRIREDWAVDRLRPGGLWYDVSVPLDAIAGYLAALKARLHVHDPGLELYVVGHLADGNLHVTVNSERPVTERYAEIAPLVYEDLKRVGGSFSAEHGIGLEKVASLASWSGARRMQLMRAVKAVFDPAGILNPGKVVGGGEGHGLETARRAPPGR
jgi:FAD/FMN-containing dehydrogenase